MKYNVDMSRRYVDVHKSLHKLKRAILDWSRDMTKEELRKFADPFNELVKVYLEACEEIGVDLNDSKNKYK